MNNPRRDPPMMPKVTQLPTSTDRPPLRPNRNTEQVYAEEALKVAQRHLDQVEQIDRLGQELEDWRRRALNAEAEIVRLEKREADLTDALERQRDKLMNERDTYRNRLNSLVSQFHTAGAIVLKCLEAAQGEAGPQVSLTALAQEIERATEPEPTPDEPLPSVVTAGPREP